MKILVYGAGVLGCNLARNLLRAGKDVTLLARGNWAAEIKQNGLRIKDKFSPCTSVSRIPVVTELAPDAMYDVIFVVLRYTQLDSVLDTLRANRTKNIVFVGNNVQARALAAVLPEKNVLFAFALSAGHREVDRVVSIDLKKITIGQLPGAISNKQLIGRIFHHYQRGGLGDMKVKKFLNSVMQAELEPIRTRRKEWEQRLPEVVEILKEGSAYAEKTAAATLAEVRKSMRIDYFENDNLLK